MARKLQADEWLFACVVGLALLAGMRTDYGRLRSPAVAYGLLALSVVLLAGVFAFAPVNGARRWIRFAGFSMQPSEVAKLALAVFLARFLERRAGREAEFWATFVPAAALTGVLAVLVVAEPDLGTALILAVICTVV